jgi:hypothetical protein
MAKKYSCGCGTWMGETCNWSGRISELVVVEYMPEYLRQSHTATGCYPHNGSVRVVAHRDCADLLLEIEDESDWSSIISTDVRKYIS